MTTTDLRVVIDSNVHISAGLFPASVPRQAVQTALKRGRVLVSADLMDELTHVLTRPKFDRYAPLENRLWHVAQLTGLAELVVPTSTIRVCRDPDDDKLLDLAVDGRATHLVTGDQDLLALHPFRGIPILTPADFLAIFA